jgi:signal transduction histidine kinase
VSDRAMTRSLRALAAIGGVFTVVAAILTIDLAGFTTWFREFDTFMTLFGVFFGVFVWIVADRQPRNGVVWTMVAAPLFGGILLLAYTLTVRAFDVPVHVATENLVPANLPDDVARTIMFFGWLWIPAILPVLTLGLLLFPTGSLPSPRWRSVGILAGIGMLILAIGSIWSYRPSNIGQVEENAIAFVGFLLVLGAAALSIVALVGRLRRAAGDVRQQIKWVLWGATTFVIVFLGVGFIFGQGPNEYLLVGPVYAAEVVFLTSYGMALAKYRLYDIDVVISRTLVYGVLAVFITGVYVGLVVGVGQWIGSGGEPNALLAISATAVVAVAFQPLRRWLQLLANRVVYGRRATPYEVLSTFSQRVTAVDPAVLSQIARALVEGTTAVAAGVWMVRGDGLRLVAEWPSGRGLPASPSDEALSSSFRGADVAHDGERLGVVALELPPGQPFSPADAELLDQVAAGLGLALRNLRLTEDLRVRLDQLRDSRRRIVAVQDMTRRRLERDLHDGAQQRLVSVKIKLGIGSSMADKAGLDDVQAALEGLRAEADETIEAVRDFARGIYPPLLEAEGLGPALVSRTRNLPVPVTVQAAGVARYPREQEATVYFCVLEAVQNAVNHSGAGSILVAIDEVDGRLSFEVRDDGAGFDVDDTPFGSGLTNISDRIDALDGQLDITSHPGRGTTIHATLPIPDMAVAT